MKYPPLYWLASLWLMFASSLCGAQNAAIKMALPEEGYAPYIIVKQDDVSGILIDVLKLAAKQVSVEILFEYMPEKRSKVMLNEGRIDARMESPRWIRDPEDYFWSEPIVNINDLFVYRNLDSNAFESDGDMQGAVLITHLGYGYPTLQPLFDIALVTRHDAATEVAMLSQLQRKTRVTKKAAVMDRHVALWLIKHHQAFKGRFKFSKRVIDSTPLHVQFTPSTKMEKWLPRLNAQIKKLKRSGVVEKIIENTLKY